MKDDVYIETEDGLPYCRHCGRCLQGIDDHDCVRAPSRSTRKPVCPGRFDRLIDGIDDDLNDTALLSIGGRRRQRFGD